MPVNRIFTLLILILGASLSFSRIMAFEETPSDLILVSEFNPPYVYTNNEGNYVGTSIDYIIPIIKNAGLSFEMKIAPWKRAMIMAMEKKNVLIYPISRIPEREDDYNWLLPLHSMNFKLFGRAGKVDVRLTDIKSGKYKFVCANHTIQCAGLEKLGIPEKSIVKISHVDDIQMSQMVIRGRVDFMLITERGLHHQLLAINSDPKAFVALDNFNFEVIEYIAGSKIFDKSLAERILKSAKQLSLEKNN